MDQPFRPSSPPLPVILPSPQVVGSVSAWIDPDSSDPRLKAQSLTTLKQQLAWAGHLGLQAVLLPPVPQTMRAAHYSQAVQQALSGLTTMAIWMTVPLTGGVPPVPPATPGAAAAAVVELSSPSSPSSSPPPAPAAAAADPWETWHQFRALSDFHHLLGCVLQLGPELPSPQLMNR